MESLFVTKSLEVTIRTLTVREEFDTGDIVVRENGVSILAAYRQDIGIIDLPVSGRGCRTSR